MKIFSKETENNLMRSILDLIDNFLKAYTRPPEKILGLITQKQLMNELDIKESTLKRWESLGLKRYMPPVENTKKAYYRVSDVLKFLGMER